MSIELLNSCVYLELEAIHIGRNSKAVIVDVAQADGVEDITASNSDLERALGPGRVIKSTPSSWRFRLVFEGCLISKITDESYSLGEDEEPPGVLRRYMKSSLLSEIEDVPWWLNERPLYHYAICCVDEVIEFISTKEPSIEVISAVTAAKITGPVDGHT